VYAQDEQSIGGFGSRGGFQQYMSRENGEVLLCALAQGRALVLNGESCLLVVDGERTLAQAPALLPQGTEVLEARTCDGARVVLLTAQKPGGRCSLETRYGFVVLGPVGVDGKLAAVQAIQAGWATLPRAWAVDGHAGTLVAQSEAGSAEFLQFHLETGEASEARRLPVDSRPGEGGVGVVGLDVSPGLGWTALEVHSGASAELRLLPPARQRTAPLVLPLTTNGGAAPKWSLSGDCCLYRNGSGLGGAVWAVHAAAGPPATPILLRAVEPDMPVCWCQGGRFVAIGAGDAVAVAPIPPAGALS